ncbi:ABC transporter permease [Sphingomonas kaistensis]|uniref:Transport permease protein n=1 Tax=Sphingomonas kaistensis TaxID=298708 RepID=A0ABZ2G3F7_9SPHN
MARLAAGWRIQRRVTSALMIRELVTRFGRENIGFLWVMVEPLLFAVLVGIVWRAMKGPEEHGVSVIAFVATGYIPLTLFRHALSRSVRVFSVNGSLLYHRQIKVLDFIFVRFLIEFIGAMMAYLFIAVVLMALGEFPIPTDMGLFFAGWFFYSWFTLALVMVLAPLSEKSDVFEKLMPVATYIMIPFSGTFAMTSWLTPAAQDALWWSPFVHGMEMMRAGIFGGRVNAIYDVSVPIAASLVLTVIGLSMCRRVRRDLVVE